MQEKEEFYAKSPSQAMRGKGDESNQLWANDVFVKSTHMSGGHGIVGHTRSNCGGSHCEGTKRELRIAITGTACLCPPAVNK